MYAQLRYFEKKKGNRDEKLIKSAGLHPAAVTRVLHASSNLPSLKASKN